MSRRWFLTIAVVGLFCGTAATQQVNLAAHVKIMHTGKNRAMLHPENVLVWLSPLDQNVTLRSFSGQALRLVQHNKSFQPHLLVVPVGAVVQFPNRDPFFHNVFSLFDGKRFDLGLYEAGSSRNVSFDKPGISYIFCNIHPEMSAVVVALATPYYGVSNGKGEILIPRVPIGRYTLHIWYEAAPQAALDAMVHQIEVTASTSTLGKFEIPANTDLTTHKNKYGMDYEPPTPDSPGYDQR